MIYFQTKNSNLGKFWRALEWKLWLCFMPICNILWPFGMYILWLFCNLVAIWYIFPSFGILCQEKIWQPLIVSPFEEIFVNDRGSEQFSCCSTIESLNSTIKRDFGSNKFSSTHIYIPMWTIFKLRPICSDLIEPNWCPQVDLYDFNFKLSNFNNPGLIKVA
jgi:hypothetical protein